MGDSKATRPRIQTSDTLDRAPQLAGQLDNNGIAKVAIGGAEQDVKYDAQSQPTTVSRASTNTSITSLDPEIENYDTQKLDPSAVIEHAQGGDIELRLGEERPKNGGRRTSIPVRLEKTDKRGRYMLHADDPEIRDILKNVSLGKRDVSPASTKRRSAIRDLVFTRRFTAFDRQNPSNAESPFHGFFTLFWLTMVGMLFRVLASNYKNYGNVLGTNELVTMMFHRDVIVLGLSDGALYLLTGTGLILQKMIARGWLRWDKSGWIIQNIWQTFFLFGAIGWTFYREWPWTHTIFLVLHTLVYLMKQHSYAFYNGYLSQCLRRKLRLERLLGQLSATSPVSTPVTSPRASTSDEQRPTSGRGTQSATTDPEQSLRHRRKSSKQTGGNLAVHPPEIINVAAAIESHEPLDQDQMETFRKLISTEIEFLNTELRGKCSVTKNYYPANLTVFNWAEWVCLPTLVYELEYPRQEKTNWAYVAEKTIATFGVIGLMMVISQAYIYPVMAETVRMKESGMSANERWMEFPWVVGDMLIPLLLEHLLTWYVIWECILNVLAEVTCFADRGFYGSWWNSVSWDQYARDWNRPVHNFLLRHVYHSSISALHLNKTSAMFVTFLLSALVHELVMFCLFKKVRGYLFCMQLTQMPLAMLSRTKFMREQKLLGNVIFWTGLFVGPSVLTSLYLIA